MRLMMQHNTYTLISLFSGVSGSSLGFHNTGRIDEILAIDNDPYVEKCFKLNFPQVPFLRTELGKTTITEILDFANSEYKKLRGLDLNLLPGNLSILFASPPCQGFSTAKGNRNPNDSRNDLYLDTLKYIGQLKPEVFIIENVKGLIQGQMRPIFNKIVNTIKFMPYEARYKVLNSALYGVPQLRERLFYIGVRHDLVEYGLEPKFPTPIISNLQGLSIQNFVRDIDFFSSTQFNKKIYHKTDICRTITASSNMIFWQAGNSRMPLISEIKSLCSFPEDYRLWALDRGINPRSGLEYNYGSKWKVIGNSVPPKLMEAVAKTVIEEILDKYHFSNLRIAS